MKNWQGITELVAIAEHGSFSKAASALGISVAQVSRHINELESKLNLKLLYRTTRSVRFTEEGNVYLQHCRHMVASLDEANRAISSFQSTPQGQIRITAPVYYGEHKLAPLLVKFAQTYPDVELELNLTNEQLDLVQRGYDLAIRLGNLASSSLIAKQLSTRKQYIVASPAYLKKHGIPNTLEDLKQHECLQGSLGYWRLLDTQGKPIQIRNKGRVVCNSGPVLIEAALADMGLVQLPDYYVESHLQRGTLISVLEHLRIPDDGIWIVYPQNRHLSAKVRHLVDFLAQFHT